MANIDPAPSWANIRRLETTDRNMAGPGGILNDPTTSIAARLNLLRDNDTTLGNSVAAVNARQDATDSEIANIQGQVLNAPGTLSDLENGAALDPAAAFPDIPSVENSLGPVGAINSSILALAARSKFLNIGQIPKFENYVSLRSYSGNADAVFVYSPTISGVFVRMASGNDDGGEVIVTSSGVVYGRVFDGPANYLWWQPAMDGTTDDTAVWGRAIRNSSRRLFIPAGRTRINNAPLVSNTQMYGIRPTFNRDTKVFSNGTVIIGGFVAPSFLSNAFISDIGIDATVGGTVNGNAINVNQRGFRNVSIRRVTSRANNHHILFEQNCSVATAGEAWGGNSIIADCECHGGPNGIAIKAANMSVLSTMCYDITVQAFVAVSDNITGSSTYSRAQNVLFRDCGGEGNRHMFNVYSRDTRSLTNENGVLPATNIRWESGSLSGTGRHGAMIGDNTTETANGPVGTQTLIPSEGVFIDGAEVMNCGYSGINVMQASGVRIDNCRFGNNGKALPSSFDSQNVSAPAGGTVSNLSIGDNNVYVGAAVGVESKSTTWPVNSGSVSVNNQSNVYYTASTALNYISTVTGGTPGQIITVVVNDDFSIVNFSRSAPGGRIIQHSGRGRTFRAMWDSVSSGWIDLGEARQQSSFEITQAFASNFVVNFSSTAIGIFSEITSDIASISMFSPPSNKADTQNRYTLRFTTVANRAISSWNSAFVFPANNAPTTLQANKTRLIEFFWDGSRMVCLNNFEY